MKKSKFKTILPFINNFLTLGLSLNLFHVRIRLDKVLSTSSTGFRAACFPPYIPLLSYLQCGLLMCNSYLSFRAPLYKAFHGLPFPQSYKHSTLSLLKHDSFFITFKPKIRLSVDAFFESKYPMGRISAQSALVLYISTRPHFS